MLSLRDQGFPNGVPGEGTLLLLYFSNEEFSVTEFPTPKPGALPALWHSACEV